MKLKTRQITVTAILLAICIVSQFFKNLNVYITGPIINAALILTTVYAGLACGIILSVITPITSFFITDAGRKSNFCAGQKKRTDMYTQTPDRLLPLRMRCPRK